LNNWNLWGPEGSATAHPHRPSILALFGAKRRSDRPMSVDFNEALDDVMEVQSDINMLSMWA
jgi:hypothetical protein